MSYESLCLSPFGIHVLVDGHEMVTDSRGVYSYFGLPWWLSGNLLATRIPGLGRFPERGHENLLEYSCLENSMDRGTWRVTAHVIAESQTQKQLSSSGGSRVILA